MAINCYLMPRVGDGTTPNTAFRAKYEDDLIAAGLTFAAVYYGAEPAFLVAVRDITPALHSTISADAECVTVPALAQTVGAQVATVQARLEAFNIPAQWVTSGMSYGSVCRFVAVGFQIMQVLTHRLGRARLFGGAVTLDTRWNQLGAGVRQDLLDLATELNFDSTGMSGTTTIRQILKALADQWPALAIRLGPVEL